MKEVNVGVSHTTPLKFEPDKSAEEWMNGIEKRLEYEMEYYGHYHKMCIRDRSPVT